MDFNHPLAGENICISMVKLSMYTNRQLKKIAALTAPAGGCGCGCDDCGSGCGDHNHEKWMRMWRMPLKELTIDNFSKLIFLMLKRDFIMIQIEELAKVVLQIIMNRNTNAARHTPELIQTIYSSLKLDRPTLMTAQPEELVRRLTVMTTAESSVLR